MRPRDVSRILEHFPYLPDDAIVPQKVSALLTGESERSWRRKKPLPTVPINGKMKGNRVGDVRALLKNMNEEAAA
jgi:hypothetical protein